MSIIYTLNDLHPEDWKNVPSCIIKFATVIIQELRESNSNIKIQDQKVSELRTEYGYKLDCFDKNIQKIDSKLNNNFSLLKNDVNKLISNLQKDVEINWAKSTQYIDDLKSSTDSKIKEINDWRRHQKDSDALRAIIENNIKEKHNSLLNNINETSKMWTQKINEKFDPTKCMGAGPNKKYKTPAEMWDSFEDSINFLISELKGDQGVYKKIERNRTDIVNSQIESEKIKDEFGHKFFVIDQYLDEVKSEIPDLTKKLFSYASDSNDKSAEAKVYIDKVDKKIEDLHTDLQKNIKQVYEDHNVMESELATLQGYFKECNQSIETLTNRLQSNYEDLSRFINKQGGMKNTTTSFNQASSHTINDTVEDEINRLKSDVRIVMTNVKDLKKAWQEGQSSHSPSNNNTSANHLGKASGATGHDSGLDVKRKSTQGLSDPEKNYDADKDIYKIQESHVESKSELKTSQMVSSNDHDNLKVKEYRQVDMDASVDQSEMIGKQDHDHSMAVLNRSHTDYNYYNLSGYKVDDHDKRLKNLEDALGDINLNLERLNRMFHTGKSVKSSMDDVILPKMFSNKDLDVKFEQIYLGMGRSRSDERRIRSIKTLDVKVNKTDFRERERKKERIINEFKERKYFNTNMINQPISKKEIQFNNDDLLVREPNVETRLNIRPKDINNISYMSNLRY